MPTTNDMNGAGEAIRQMRALLGELESYLAKDSGEVSPRNFDAFELPGLVAAIVDYLQPILLPYEAAIYWHLFRASVLESAKQYARTSIRGLTDGVITSSSGQSASLSYSAVQKAVRGLEQKGVLVKAGDTTRTGTLYKVNLPEDIALCRERMRAASDAQREEVDVRKELDFYNVSENRVKVFERDGYRCRYCGKQLTRFTATLDHLQPVSRGGDNSFENLVTACLHCNSCRGNGPVMEALREPVSAQSVPITEGA